MCIPWCDINKEHALHYRSLGGGGGGVGAGYCERWFLLLCAHEVHENFG